jgi:hypothetical protein
MIFNIIMFLSILLLCWFTTASTMFNILMFLIGLLLFWFVVGFILEKIYGSN